MHKIFVILILLRVALRTMAAPIEQFHSRDFIFKADTTGNPFDVELAADFTGPDGARLRVPEFYDGDGVWKIRFSPTQVGEWSFLTTSSLGALNGKSESGIVCVPNRHPNFSNVTTA